MLKGLSAENHRLKYANTFIVLTALNGEEGVVELKVEAPLSGLEKSSFLNITKEINKLLSSGVRKRSSILEVIKRLPMVDNRVLKFMSAFVRDKLRLEDR